MKWKFYKLVTQLPPILRYNIVRIGFSPTLTPMSTVKVYAVDWALQHTPGRKKENFMYNTWSKLLLLCVIALSQTQCITGYIVGRYTAYSAITGTDVSIGKLEIEIPPIIIIEEIVTIPLFPATFVLGATVGSLAGAVDLPRINAENAAENPATSKERLADLAESSRAIVRSSVARNPNTSGDTLRRLGNDRDYVVRSGVAENPNAPADVLLKLSSDPEEFVREQVGSNIHTSGEALCQLATDKNCNVRCSVVANPKTPDHVLQKLAGDESPNVRENVAGNPRTTGDLLQKLSEDHVSYVRIKVAQNPHTPPTVLKKLADDEDTDVRRAVAENPSTPTEVLKKIESARPEIKTF